MDRFEPASIPTGLPIEEALATAATAWTQLLGGGKVSESIGRADQVPDVLYAIARHLRETQLDDPIATFEGIASLYGYVIDQPQLFGDRDEARAVAADFAFLAWDACRRESRCREMRQWEERCVSDASSQDSVRDFLTVPIAEHSARLCERFLYDGATLLALCQRLAIRRNIEPMRAAEDARLAYVWLTTNGSRYPRDTHAYFMGELALDVTVALKHLGRFSEAEQWATLSRRSFAVTSSPGPALARLDFILVTMLFDRHCPQKALERMPAVLENLAQYELWEEFYRCRFLEASALKSAGRLTECLELLRELRECPDVRADQMLLGLVLINIAELSGPGSLEESSALFAEALPLLEAAGVRWGLADRLAMMGEVLRDHGRLEEAVRSYRSAITALDTLHMDGRAAYLRILAAETLIASDREQEAIEELLVALPVLDREALIPDAIAAVALLRESLRRRKADSGALRSLRTLLERG